MIIDTVHCRGLTLVGKCIVEMMDQTGEFGGNGKHTH